MSPTPMDTAAKLVAALARRGETVATAESLTGGLLCAELVSVPGASAVVRGGVVAYATDLKTTQLGVPADLVAAVGVVSAEVATAMAAGARAVTGATWGVATTGVAGPDPQDGVPVGTVHLAVAGPVGTRHQGLSLGAPGRDRVRAATVAAALDLLLAATGEGRDPGPTLAPS